MERSKGEAPKLTSDPSLIPLSAVFSFHNTW